jgi:hypothetical protein
MAICQNNEKDAQIPFHKVTAFWTYSSPLWGKRFENWKTFVKRGKYRTKCDIFIN